MKNYFLDKTKEKSLYYTVYIPLVNNFYSLLNYTEYYYPHPPVLIDSTASQWTSKQDLKKLDYKEGIFLTNINNTFSNYTIPAGSIVYNWLRADTYGSDSSCNPARKNFSSYLLITPSPAIIYGLKLNSDFATFSYEEYNTSESVDKFSYFIWLNFFRNFGRKIGTITEGSYKDFIYYEIYHFGQESQIESSEQKVTYASTDTNFIVQEYCQMDSITSDTFSLAELSEDSSFVILEGDITKGSATALYLKSDYNNNCSPNKFCLEVL